MRRYDRPIPVHRGRGWQERNKRGASKESPDYVANRIEELRVQGQQLMHNQRCLTEDIEAAREAGLLTDKLEAQLAEEQRDFAQVEEKIKKLYERRHH